MIKHWGNYFKILVMSFFLSHVCEAVALEKLTVMLDWFANLNHAPLFIAQEQGFFEKNGLEVKILVPADPSDPPKLLAAKKIDIALDYQPNLLLEKSRGLPLTQIGTLIDKPLNCLLVLKSKGITQISDLRGKQIAYSSPAIDLFMLETMLKKHHVALKEVKTINVHYALSQGLLAGRVDAAIGMMRNVESIQFKLMQQPIIAFMPEKNGVPSYSELVFIANVVQKKPQMHQQFLLAIKEGIAYIKSHPQESWAQLIKDRPELNNELNKNAWNETITYFTLNPEYINKDQSLEISKWLGLAETTRLSRTSPR